MGVRKHRGGYEVKVYDPAVKRKVYVGRRKLEKDAKALFRRKTEEFNGARTGQITVRQYADEWLDLNHGPGTRRPAPTTKQVNEGNLRQFLDTYGERKLDGGITRREALAWSKPRPHVAKTVSAMFNDAVDDETCRANPFANRRHERSRERRDIHPITQAELDRLEQIALWHWGPDGYGRIARAWVLFSAWVGCRPGETFTIPLRNVNFHEGLVTIRRCKPPYNTDTVVLPKAALEPLQEIVTELAQSGPMFRTVTGLPMDKGSTGYHWRPIAAAFREKVTDERWEQLTEGTGRLDLYALRHRVASVMADRGATAAEIAEQLGNSPAVCEATYIHPFKTDIRERNRKLLDRPAVVDLQAYREETGA